MKNWVLIAVMMLALPAIGVADQDDPEEKVPREATEVFQLKYAPVDSVWRVLQAFEAIAKYDSNLQIISVSGTKETVAEVAEVIKKLDVPSSGTKNVELVFHILRARRGGAAATERTLPEALRDVATQMETVLGLDNVELIESALIRVRDGSDGSTRGFLSGIGHEASYYQVSFKGASVSGEGQRLAVSLRDLRFTTQVKLAGQSSSWDVGINTNVDIGSGQKAVVGKAGVGDQGDHIVLVIAARVV